MNDSDPAARTASGDPTRDTSFRPDQLVVALSHLQPVTEQLGRWDVSTSVEPDPRLGLALLSFDVGRAADRIRVDDHLRHGQQDHDHDDHGRPPAAIDVVSAGLRSAFAQRWNGWQPTLGKNRVLAHVGGSYVIDIGGVGPDLQAQYVIDIGGGKKRYVIDIGGDDSTTGRPGYVDGSAAGFGDRHGEAGDRVRVAVVDTGMLPHPWLAGTYRCGADALLDSTTFDGNASDDDPAAHHGTFVAGLVVRQAPAVQLWVERALDTTGHQDSWLLARQLGRLADRGADIVNLSLGCFTDDNRPPLVLQRAVEVLGSQTLVVAAAGNYATPAPVSPRPSWPAALESVVAVGSTDPGGGPSDFSPAAPWVDVRAPGRQVVSTYDGGGHFIAWDGTSFAAATVSGAIAAQVGRGSTAPETWRRIQAGLVTVPGVQVQSPTPGGEG